MQVQQQQQQRPLQQQGQYYASQPTQAVQGRTRGNVNGTGKRPGFASRATMVFGIFQIIFGGICVILGITAIVIQCQLREAGIGIWCGVMFALAGVFGLLASFKKTNAMIITTMVLSIIAATMAGSACITNIIAAAIEQECYYHYRNYYYFCESNYGGRVAVDSILAVVTLAELVIAILQSVFCCAAYCCNQTSSTRYQSTMHFASSNQEGVVQGYPMTVLQNPPVQYMAPSGVQFVPQNLYQQQAPQGYMVATQPTVISNQPPSGQMQPQPGVVYQQGQ
ncbi:membrane-spanning 4-domains subfamily A member 4D-like [Ptychodera flava]|uniref:membrane-spanning 4-domains subfamily A member 4D-like n=1 Tax=Ptychodera flava TaxID=63121 RepID=UPI003969CCA8